MALTKQYVKCILNQPGDYVDDVEELCEEWLKMKEALEWIKSNSHETNVLEYIERVYK